ncbi:expressed hypothetical protein [Trichoplax adhaerens]|uniref:NADH dehydrogenase [ubiquinone] 1 alpha subcomplex subunit 9, mitochondrial n=1 Tax=Trichoplax adhaerens TaxID=10228 RepID=B3RLB8_TRIAD|nr:expressed hypothetical protein [Trichoplax adhaerens]EDV29517.1 expressed hypothetical protein [Trichoplax adhaerens]|eukprot:XP_002108719.1 expressed hypothetical protein [Trichoplax adhaerens]
MMLNLSRRRLPQTLTVSSVRTVICGSSINDRKLHQLVKSGRGGRSSYSGILATVFGGTGFTGRYVINRLGRVGTQIMVPYRCDEHDIRHIRLMGDLGQIMFRPFSLRDTDAVSELVKHSNVVINLIGQDWETRNYTYEDANVEGARAIARACRDHGVERLIHVSALNVDKNSKSHWLRSKAAGEEAVLEEFPDATIVRPSDIYGQEDRFFNYYAELRMLPFGVPLLDGGLKATKIPLYVADFAKAIAKMTVDDTTAGRIYELYGPHEYLLYDLVGTIFSAFLSVMETVGYIPWLTRDKLIRQNLSDRVTPELPGLEDLGIEKTTIDKIATFVLRRHVGVSGADIDWDLVRKLNTQSRT